MTATSAKWPISTQGGFEPLWSHNGRELFYRGNGGVMSVAVTTHPTFLAGASTLLFPSLGIFPADGNHRGYDITPDDKRFIFSRAVGAAVEDKIIVVENFLEELKNKK